MTASGIRSTAVRYLKSRRLLFVEGEDGTDDMAGWGLERIAGSGFFVPLDVALPITLSSLRRSLRHAFEDDAAGEGFTGWVDLPRDASLIIADVQPDWFDSKYSPYHSAVLDLVDDDLLVCVNIDLQREDWDEFAVRRVLEPMLRRVNAAVADCAGSEHGPFAGNPWPWQIRLRLPIRGRIVADALEIADAVTRLLSIADSGKLDAGTARDLVLAGRSVALLGQAESDWLEAKALGWDLETEAGKIELAQDVARFANGESAGLMIVGLGTKKVGGAEVLVQGPRQTFSASDAQRHHKVIDQRVYPPVEGLSVTAAPTEGNAQLLVFWIPAQPPELKPFLVHGVVVGSKVEGAFFSIVRRRGEHSIPVSAQAIHAQIAAGRALLRNSMTLIGPEEPESG